MGRRERRLPPLRGGIFRFYAGLKASDNSEPFPYCDVSLWALLSCCRELVSLCGIGASPSFGGRILQPAAVGGHIVFLPPTPELYPGGTHVSNQFLRAGAMIFGTSVPFRVVCGGRWHLSYVFGAKRDRRHIACRDHRAQEHRKSRAGWAPDEVGGGSTASPHGVNPEEDGVGQSHCRVW